MRRQPFPRPGEPLIDGLASAERFEPQDEVDELWTSLTIGGRIAVCFEGAVAAVWMLAVAAGAIFGGVHGDQEAAL